MATHTFSTDVNPALYIESAAVDVLSGSTPVKVSPRPVVGTVVKVRNAVTLANLTDTATTNNNGFLSFTTTDVSSVLISVNNWSTSVGPFWSKEATAAFSGITDASLLTSGTLAAARLPDLSATYAIVTGNNTLTGSQLLQTSVNGSHPLRVWADKLDGGGLLERFTVENTSGGGGCDVNFRNVDINVSTSAVGAYPGHIKFYSAPSSSYQPIRVFASGSTTNASWSLNQAGGIASYAKGLSSGPTFALAAWGDANDTFTIAAPDGKVQWGVGGATALDTNLYRSAAGILKTDGKIAANAIFAGVTNLLLQDSSQNTAVTVSAANVQFAKRVEFLGDASSITLLNGCGIVNGTTTGTKFGTGATQKMSFYGVTPIVQPASTPAAATDLATVLTLANDLRTKLLALGLVA